MTLGGWEFHERIWVFLPLSFLLPSSFFALPFVFLSYSLPLFFLSFPQFFLSCSSLFSVPLVRSSLPFLFLIQICSSIFISTELRRHSDTAPNNKKTIGFFSKAKTRNFDGASFIVRVSICSLFQHQHCLILLIYIYIHIYIDLYQCIHLNSAYVYIYMCVDFEYTYGTYVCIWMVSGWRATSVLEIGWNWLFSPNLMYIKLMWNNAKQNIHGISIPAGCRRDGAGGRDGGLKNIPSIDVQGMCNRRCHLDTQTDDDKCVDFQCASSENLSPHNLIDFN